jgi:hypothetical protein
MKPMLQPLVPGCARSNDFATDIFEATERGFNSIAFRIEEDAEQI